MSGWILFEPLIRENGLSAVLVPDTSLLMRHPDLVAWRLGFPALLVISDLVLAELDTHKGRKNERQDEAEAAAAVLKSIASIANESSVGGRRHLSEGIRANDSLWIGSCPVDRVNFPPGLNAKRADDQIASVAWQLRRALVPTPVLLLTSDQGQSVFASAAGVDYFLTLDLLDEESRLALRGLIEALTLSPGLVTDPLESFLPPRETIVPLFVGRELELNALDQWLKDRDKPKWALVGDGGKGKSAIAFEFADRVRRFNPTREFNTVIWMSAKTRRFREGQVEQLSPDFGSIDEALDFLLLKLGDLRVGESTGAKKRRVLGWLAEYPAFIVVDDIDSVTSENAEVRSFFSDEVLRTKARVLFTSRRSLFGMEARQTEVKGLEGPDGRNFILRKADELGQDRNRFANSIDRILAVTEGSPLYIEDLLRLCRILPVGDAIHQWDRRRGEEARAYALQRELEELSRSNPLDSEVLIACAVCNGQVSPIELSKVVGKPQETIENALDHLRHYYLVPAPAFQEDLVLFDLNYNTRNLVLTLYGTSELAERFRGAYTSLGRFEETRGEESRIESVCTQVRLLAKSGRFDEARSVLDRLDAEFPNRSLIYQQLGWLLKRWEPSPQITEAAEAFTRAADLGGKRMDLYWHWAELEEQRGRFREAAEIATRGMKVLGTSRSLCYREAVARLRFGLTLQRLQDRQSSIDQLHQVIALVRRGLGVQGLRWETPELVSRLYGLGVRSAQVLKLRDVEDAMLSEWKLVDPAAAADFTSRDRHPGNAP